MAPPELIGRYKEYKARTKTFLYWLTRTGNACCTLSSSANSTTPSKTHTYPQTSTTNTTKFGPATERRLTTGDLIKLAEAISTAAPAVNVPSEVLSSIEDIIGRREQAAQWYSSQALKEGSEVSQEDGGHRYFISVLHRIFLILKKVGEEASVRVPVEESKPRSKRKNKPKHQAQQAQLRNMFDSLDLQEPTANALGASPHPKTAMALVSVAEVTLELECDDSAFKTWCFLQDLDDLRMYVKRIWEEYSRGDVSFLAVSSITATAFGLLRRADMEFDSPFGSTDWLQLMDYLGIDYFVRGHAIWLHPNPDRRTKEPRMPDASVNIVHLLCPIAFECLSSWKTDIDAFCTMEKLCMKTGEAQRLSGSDKRDFHPMCRRFSSLLNEIHPLACHSRENLVDEFVQGLAEIHLKSEIPMWMVTACQMLLDVHSILDKHVDQGVHQLREKFAFVRQMGQDLVAYQKQASRGMGDVKEANDGFRELLRQLLQTQSKIKLPSECRLPADKQHARSTLDSNVTLKEAVLPATAGEILVDISTSIYKVGCGMVKHGCFVLSMAHLYKGLRAMGVLKETWADMEFVISCFGSDDNKSALVAREGGQQWNHESGDQAVRHYLLAIGCQAREIVASRKENLREEKSVQPGEARSVRILSAFLQGLCNRQDEDQAHGLRRPRTRILETVLHALADRETSSGDGKVPLSSSHSRPSFKATHLLETMKKRWIRDEPTLHFDFVGFMLSCVRLLDSIASQPGRFQDFRLSNLRHNYTTMVQRLLLTAPDWPELRSTASLLQSHIATDGKLFTKKANDQSSNRIPKHLRPHIQEEQEFAAIEYDSVRCTMDYANAHFSISGQTLAAYHPGIVPEVDSGTTDRRSTAAGRETDPNKDYDHYVQGRAFGSMIPEAITQESLLNIAKDDTKFLASRSRLLKYHVGRHAVGALNDADFEDIACQITGHRLVKLQTQGVKDGEVDTSTPVREEWCFRAVEGQKDYQRYLGPTAKLMGKWREAYKLIASMTWSPWPLVAYLHYASGETEASEAVDASIERCAHRALNMHVDMVTESMADRHPELRELCKSPEMLAEIARSAVQHRNARI